MFSLVQAQIQRVHDHLRVGTREGRGESRWLFLGQGSTLRGMWFLWAVIIVLGIIPMIFWGAWALLKILALVGTAVTELLEWAERRIG